MAERVAGATTRERRLAALRRANAAWTAAAEAHALWAVRQLLFVYPRHQTTAPPIAAALMGQGVPTPWGKRHWHRTQVERLMRRAGIWG